MTRVKNKFGKPVPGYGGYYYYQALRREFKPIKEREIGEPGTWDAERSKNSYYAYCVFITCPSCNHIVKFFSSYVEKDGRIYKECTVCRSCLTHFFPKLCGWKKFLKEIKRPPE